jgi:hypothetical protein
MFINVDVLLWEKHQNCGQNISLVFIICVKPHQHIEWSWVVYYLINDIVDE